MDESQLRMELKKTGTELRPLHHIRHCFKKKWPGCWSTYTRPLPALRAKLAIKNKEQKWQVKGEWMAQNVWSLNRSLFKRVLMWEEHIHRETERGGDSC